MNIKIIKNKIECELINKKDILKLTKLLLNKLPDEKKKIKYYKKYLIDNYIGYELKFVYKKHNIEYFCLKQYYQKKLRNEKFKKILNI